LIENLKKKQKIDQIADELNFSTGMRGDMIEFEAY
jgi:hypothetical protein